MIIEFTGAPCCGKSAVSHALAELFRADGISVTEKPYVLSHLTSKGRRSAVKAANVLRCVLLHPVIALKAFRFGSVRWWFNFLFIYSCCEKKKICILEQGLCQCVASLFDGKTASSEKIRTCFTELFPYETDRWQIFITVKEEKIRSRITKRSDTPYYETTGNTDDAIRRSVETNRMLYQQWESRYGCENCLMFSNDEDGGENKVADMLYNELRMRGVV